MIKAYISRLSDVGFDMVSVTCDRQSGCLSLSRTFIQTSKFDMGLCLIHNLQTSSPPPLPSLTIIRSLALIK
jgi:hypothetical protein